METKLWHVVVTGLASALVSVVLTLGIVSLVNWQHQTEGQIKALAGELERVDKNSQVLYQMMNGRKGSMGIAP